LVHVREVLAQIAVAGFDKTPAVLMSDSADISRVEDQDIGFDLQIPVIGHDQIMGDSAIRYLNRWIPLRHPDRRRIERGAGLARACRA
jgi:hypothetical protein